MPTIIAKLIEKNKDYTKLNAEKIFKRKFTTKDHSLHHMTKETFSLKKLVFIINHHVATGVDVQANTKNYNITSPNKQIHNKC